MTEDSMHRTLDAALDRTRGGLSDDECGQIVAASLDSTRVLAGRGGDVLLVTVERILAAHTAAAKREGARAVVEAVETELAAEETRLAPYGPDPSGLLGNWLGGIRIAGHAAREAAARVEGGA